jgi:hypothetical protein
MAHDLEAPCTADNIDWSRLYRARGDEVNRHRPVFTGDVFLKVEVEDADGATVEKDVIIVQHPCALRSNGVDLVPKLLAAEVRRHPVIPPEKWAEYGRIMPLPDLFPDITSGRRNQAGFFAELHLVSPKRLENRTAGLSQLGVNLFLQRWVRHNSRVVVPAVTYNEATSSVYDEADLIEEWCDERTSAEFTVEQATAECVAWLRDTGDTGLMRQTMLEDPQTRSTVRKQMRIALKALRASG